MTELYSTTDKDNNWLRAMLHENSDVLLLIREAESFEINGFCFTQEQFNALITAYQAQQPKAPKITCYHCVNYSNVYGCGKESTPLVDNHLTQIEKEAGEINPEVAAENCPGFTSNAKSFALGEDFMQIQSKA